MSFIDYSGFHVQIESIAYVTRSWQLNGGGTGIKFTFMGGGELILPDGDSTGMAKFIALLPKAKTDGEL